MITSQDTDDAVRQTDFDALSSRLSCYLKGYNPEDDLLLDLIPLLLHYQILSCPSEFKRFALSRKLKHQFFNLFPTNLSDITKILNFNNNDLISKINRFTPLKPPMINRGTYLRTTSMSKNIAEFLNEYSHLPKIQIVSLGAGNDTRPFQFLPKYENLHYFELDFEFTTKLKKLAILSSSKLASKLNLKSLSISELPNNSDDIEKFDPALHSERYHLIPSDLRSLKPNTKLISSIEFSHIDSEVPTLIISECCICYLSKEDSNNVIQFWRNNLNFGKFLMYEPLGGKSTDNSKNNYGEIMVKNLICRGIEMPTLLIYGTVDSQIERFKELLKSSDDSYKYSIWCKDMKWVYDNELDINELDRISQLEMLDELEELNLINSHYCLMIAKWELKQ